MKWALEESSLSRLQRSVPRCADGTREAACGPANLTPGRNPDRPLLTIGVLESCTVWKRRSRRSDPQWSMLNRMATPGQGVHTWLNKVTTSTANRKLLGKLKSRDPPHRARALLHVLRRSMLRIRSNCVDPSFLFVGGRPTRARPARSAARIGLARDCVQLQLSVCSVGLGCAQLHSTQRSGDTHSSPSHTHITVSPLSRSHSDFHDSL